MKKALFVFALLVFIAAPGFAQDCGFKLADDNTLKEATKGFHDIMAPLWHGPIPEGDVSGLKDQIDGLIAARDAIMNASLPTAKAALCPAFTAKAKEFAASVDALAKLVNEGGSVEAIQAAFKAMHDTYSAMNGTLVTMEDLTKRFHDIMAPLWHEAYEAKDIARIKKEGALLPRIAASIKAKNTDESKKTPADLVVAVDALKNAIESGSDAIILEALSQVHDAYHAVIDEFGIEDQHE